jgi:hypothetical protein
MNDFQRMWNEHTRFLFTFCMHVLKKHVNPNLLLSGFGSRFEPRTPPEYEPAVETARSKAGIVVGPILMLNSLGGELVRAVSIPNWSDTHTNGNYLHNSEAPCSWQVEDCAFFNITSR